MTIFKIVKKQKKSVPTLLFSVVLMRWHSIFLKCNLVLFSFLGKDIDEHFMNLGKKQVKDYVDLAECLCSSVIPTMPSEWAFCPGWVKYDEDGIPVPVEYPEECVIVFDVETMVQEGNYPAMATAVSDKYW
jgi:DNA polymerase gamma 1